MNSFYKKQKTTMFSCILAVVVIVLLLCGDLIISKFIPINPNQTFEEEEVYFDDSMETDFSATIDPSYDTSFLLSESLSSLVKRIQNEETVLVFSGRSTCGPCRVFLPILKEVSEATDDLAIYYLDRNLITEETEGYSEFINISTTLKTSFSSTPFLMVFQNGEFSDSVLGIDNDLSITKDRILSLILRNF